jgi:hypothetical protein
MPDVRNKPIPTLRAEIITPTSKTGVDTDFGNTAEKTTEKFVSVSPSAKDETVSENTVKDTNMIV